MTTLPEDILRKTWMGVDRKPGIQKEDRARADRYAARYGMVSHNLEVSRATGKKCLYLVCEDADGLEYRIRFDKVKRMSPPIGVQVTNRLHYLIIQSDEVHGIDTYDFSMVKESDIKFRNKLPIICKTHGVFYKSKAALISEREGCPECSKNRYNNNKKYFKK